MWKNVLEWVKKWSGINSEYDIDIDSLPEYKALTYNTYLNAIKQEATEDEAMYVGIDIGWKKTLITYFDEVNLSNQDFLDVCHARIKYAGCDISLMKEDVLAVQEFFSIYAELLSILLNGSTEYKKNDKFCKILENFEKYCKGQDTGHHAYYQGVFDLIAILIEEETPNTDMYNNMQEYRKFIGMLTYNLFLVFLNIGYLLGKANKKAQKVYLYLGGNGAKFIHWISNCKKVTYIDEKNCHNVFLLSLEQSILDIIKKGFEITGNRENSPEEICIVLPECAKEQLVRGYMFKESYDLQKEKGSQTDTGMHYPRFTYTEVDNIFESEIQKNRFEDITDKMYKDIFEVRQKNENPENVTETSLRIVQTNDYTLNIDELISEKSKNVCREIIKKIYKMQSKQDE